MMYETATAMIEQQQGIDYADAIVRSFAKLAELEQHRDAIVLAMLDAIEQGRGQFAAHLCTLGDDQLSHLQHLAWTHGVRSVFDDDTAEEHFAPLHAMIVAERHGRIRGGPHSFQSRQSQQPPSADSRTGSTERGA